MPHGDEDPPGGKEDDAIQKELLKVLSDEETSQGKQPGGTVTRARSPQPPKDLINKVHAQLERYSRMSFLLKDALTSIKDISKLEAEGIMEEIKALFHLFQQDHLYLVVNSPPSHLADHQYFKDQVTARMGVEYHKLRRLLCNRVIELSPPPVISSSSEDSTRTQRPRLPELTIPKFTGEYLKWPDFKALFLSVIGSRKDLAELERYQYLKGVVSGPAADLINNLPPNDSAFVSAMKLLTDRYENTRLIVGSHLDRVLNLTPMTKRSSKSLLKLVDIANEMTQALASLTPHDFSSCCLLVQHLIRLLDKDTRELWEQSLGKSDKFPSLTDLISFLTTRAHALENIEKAAQPSTYSSKAASHKATTQSAGSVTRRSTQPESRYCCDMCSGDHFIVTCTKFRDLPVVKRMAVVRDQALCYSCLGRHNIKRCNSKWVCKVCQEKHHTMLHGGDSSILFTQRATLTPTQRVIQPPTQRATQLPPRPAGESSSSDSSSAPGPSTTTQ